MEFEFFADETSNMINELIIWPVSFLSSSRLKNPFKESIITKDFIFDILSMIDLKFSCKLFVFGQSKVVFFDKEFVQTLQSRSKADQSQDRMLEYSILVIFFVKILSL